MERVVSASGSYNLPVNLCVTASKGRLAASKVLHGASLDRH